MNDEFLMPSADEGTDAAELLDGLWPDAESRALEIRSKLLERLVP